MTWKFAPRDADHRLWPWLVRGLWALFVFTVVRNAWLCDDAYIYLRSVMQLWSGHGPVWNAGWRVQAFTSPLWYALLAASRIFLTDDYIRTLLLSGLLIAFVWHRWQRALASPQQQALLLAAWLVSNGFMDYTTSGLETPLAYAVLSGFLLAYLRQQGDVLRGWPRLNIWAGLVSLTRLDLLILIAPAWFTAARRVWLQDRKTWWRGVWLAAALAGLWYGFALVYYGSPLPNPAYAKLFHGLPRRVVLAQGGRYWIGQALLDPATLLIGLVAGLALAFGRDPRGRALATGAGLYALYLTWIGGDFMAGRFVAFAYLWLVAGALILGLQPQRGHPWVVGLALTILGLYAWLFPHTPVNSPWDYEVSPDFYLQWGVGDERGRYFRYTSLLTYLVWRTQPDAPPFFPPYAWSQMGYEFRASPEPIAVVDSVGMFGYWAGPDKMVLDQWALTDPFLARLPDADGRLWRPGHYERNLPAGYLESLRTGENRLVDPTLRALYDLTVWATRAPLFEAERWMHLPAWWFARAPNP